MGERELGGVAAVKSSQHAHDVEPPQHNPTLLERGMHEVEKLLGAADDKKPADDPAAQAKKPADLFALLTEMKPQVTPFEDLKNPSFAIFFHRFQMAWYASREIVENHDHAPEQRAKLHGSIVAMAEALVDLQTLSAEAAEGQDAELARLATQVPRLAALL